jgi:hypothetical protein
MRSVFVKSNTRSDCTISGPSMSINVHGVLYQFSLPCQSLFHMPFAPFGKFPVRFHLRVSILWMESPFMEERICIQYRKMRMYILREQSLFPFTIAPGKHPAWLSCYALEYRLSMCLSWHHPCGPDDKDFIAQKHGDISEFRPFWGLHSIKSNIYYILVPDTK